MQGKESLPLRLIPQTETKTHLDAFVPKKGDLADSIETLEEAQQSQTALPKTTSDKELLLPLVEDYHMSVTHLNNFLDVTKGGPRFFFEQNLLLFPQAKSPSGSFGTAIHTTFERIYSYLRREGKMPNEDEVSLWFLGLIKKERMSLSDEKHYGAKGEKILSLYLEKNKEVFNVEHRIEVNFKNQGVCVGDARLSGKIDRIEKTDEGVCVFDLKTGKSAESWEATSPDEKIKLYRYKRQLLFYKILVEGSTEFKNQKMVKGVLEFLEPKKNEFIRLEASFEKTEVERLKELIKSVNSKIKSLDFPDTSKYPQTLAGIESFEEDLLAGKI
jgi:DNA helicase-2/ATP-dependent DNA helicase PcrA